MGICESGTNAADRPSRVSPPEALNDEVVGLVGQAREQDYLDPARSRRSCARLQLAPGEAENSADAPDLGIDVVEIRTRHAGPLARTSPASARR